MADTQVEKLLPCPFCGSTTEAPIERVVHVTFDELSTHPYGVQCDGCCAFIGSCEDEEDAIAAWNIRPAMTAQSPNAGLVERAKELGDALYAGVRDALRNKSTVVTLNLDTVSKAGLALEAIAALLVSNRSGVEAVQKAREIVDELFPHLDKHGSAIAVRLQYWLDTALSPTTLEEEG